MCATLQYILARNALREGTATIVVSDEDVHNAPNSKRPFSRSRPPFEAPVEDSWADAEPAGDEPKKTEASMTDVLGVRK